MSQKLDKEKEEQIIKSTIIKANQINADDIFSDEIFAYLENECKRIGIPVEFLIPGLLSTISYLMKNTIILVCKDHVETSVMYTALIANPSTGKSSSFKLLQKALREIEDFDQVEESSLVKGATVEAVVSILAKKSCVLSLFDESSGFMGSFGRYNPGGASLDRAIYLELFNGADEFRRDLCNKSSVVTNPRLNISLLGHPSFFIKAMREEQQIRDDGLMQRFLSCCPKPKFDSASEINEARTNQRKFSFSVLLYVVARIHNRLDGYESEEPNQEKPTLNEYSFSKSALTEFDKTYTEYRSISKDMNDVDVFISAMFGKAITHLIRIAAILHTFEVSFEILNKLEAENKFKLTVKLRDIIDKAIELKASSCWIIQEGVLVSARSLLDFFVLNRLILAGYNCSMNYKSNSQNITSILHFIKESNLNAINITLAQHILLSPGNTIDSMQIVNKKLATSSEIVHMFQYLSNNGLGTYTERKNPTGVSTKIFRKTNFDTICSEINLIILLESLTVDLKNYKKYFDMPNITKKTKEKETIPTEDQKDKKQDIFENVSSDIPRIKSPKHHLTTSPSEENITTKFSRVVSIDNIQVATVIDEAKSNTKYEVIEVKVETLPDSIVEPITSKKAKSNTNRKALTEKQTKYPNRRKNEKEK